MDSRFRLLEIKPLPPRAGTQQASALCSPGTGSHPQAAAASQLMSQMLAGQGKTAPVAEVVQTAPPPAYNQAVQAEVVHAAPMSPPMVVTCPPGVAPGQPMRVVDPATGQTMQVTVPNGVKPGGQFQVQFPAPQPVVQAPAQGQVCTSRGKVVHQAVAP